MKAKVSKTDALSENDLDKIAGLTELLAEKERVERLEKWAVAVGEKVGVKLKI